jgi:hypothetical protein
MPIAPGNFILTATDVEDLFINSCLDLFVVSHSSGTIFVV